MQRTNTSASNRQDPTPPSYQAFDDRETTLVRRSPWKKTKYISYEELGKRPDLHNVLFKVKVRSPNTPPNKNGGPEDGGGKRDGGRGGSSGGGKGTEENVEEGDLGDNVEDEKKKKTVSSRMSYGIKKYPFLSLALIGTLAIGGNTLLTVAGIRLKEDRIMKKKMEKGELPVAVLPPAPNVAPDPDLVKPKVNAAAAAMKPPNGGAIETAPTTSNESVPDGIDGKAAG